MQIQQTMSQFSRDTFKQLQVQLARQIDFSPNFSLGVAVNQDTTQGTISTMQNGQQVDGVGVIGSTSITTGKTIVLLRGHSGAFGGQGIMCALGEAPYITG